MAGLGDYMHQQSLLDAYKKLYMLGHRGHSKSHEQLDSDIEGFGATAGGIDKAYRDKLARDKAAMATLKAQQDSKRAHEAQVADRAGQEFDEMYRYNTQGGPAYQEWKSVVAGNAVPTNPYKEALAKQEVDKQASQSNIGGYYTPQGLQQADKEGTANAHDRLMLRALVPGPTGLAGSVPNPPPNYMNNYGPIAREPGF